MITDVEYSLMAGRAYESTRDEANWFPVPDGWQEAVDHRKALDSGFEATYFQRGKEIVISFAGTGPGLTNIDWLANSDLATGRGAQQLYEAAAYYMEVRKDNPNAHITLTGHSLGGGLAGLVGVFFDEDAVTFDQAPFQASANNTVRDQLVQYLADSGYISGDAIDELRAFHSDLPFPGGGGTPRSDTPGVRGEADRLSAH